MENVWDVARKAQQTVLAPQHEQFQNAVQGMSILQAMQKQQQDAMLREALAKGDTAALLKLPGGVDILGKLATQQNAGVTAQLHQAQLGEIQRKGGIANQEQAAKGALASLVAGGGYQANNPAEMAPTAVMQDPAAAEKAFREQYAKDPNAPIAIDVPNPANVKGLAIAAGNSLPRSAVAAILNPGADKAATVSPLARLMAEKQALPAGDPRHAVYDKYITHLSDPQSQAAPKQEPLVPVKQSDGRIVYTPRSDAVGQEVGGRTTDINLGKQVQQLGTAMEKAGLPQMIPVVENAAKITPELASYITGPKSLLADRLIPKEAIDARQDVQKLFNIVLKDRSGAAVTNQELQRLQTEFSKGLIKTPEALVAAIGKAKSIVEAHYHGVAAGFGKDALDAYNTNLEAIGGKPFRPGASTRPAEARGVLDAADAILKGGT